MSAVVQSIDANAAEEREQTDGFHLIIDALKLTSFSDDLNHKGKSFFDAAPFTDVVANTAHRFRLKTIEVNIDPIRQP